MKISLLPLCSGHTGFLPSPGIHCPQWILHPLLQLLACIMPSQKDLRDHILKPEALTAHHQPPCCFLVLVSLCSDHLYTILSGGPVGSAAPPSSPRQLHPHPLGSSTPHPLGSNPLGSSTPIPSASSLALTPTKVSRL